MNIYNNTNDYNLKTSRKILIVFDGMIAHINTNKKLQFIVKLFNRCRRLNISLVFIKQSCFIVPKDVRLNSAHYLIMKIHNKRALQNIAINHSSNIYYKDVMKIYKEYLYKIYLLSTNDISLPANIPLRFRKNILDSL